MRWRTAVHGSMSAGRIVLHSALLVALCGLASRAECEDWAQVRSNFAMLYDAPNGKVITQVQRGKLVTIGEYADEWAHLVYVDGNFEIGFKGGAWARLSDLDIVERRNYTGTKECEEEPKSGAELCLLITSSSIDCDEDYDTDLIEDCRAEVHYRIDSDYHGKTGLSADVRCEVTVKYRRKGSAYWFTDEAEDKQREDIRAGYRASGDFELEFSFGPYEEVESVKIESVTCKLENLELE